MSVLKKRGKNMSIMCEMGVKNYSKMYFTLYIVWIMKDTHVANDNKTDTCSRVQYDGVSRDLSTA